MNINFSNLKKTFLNVKNIFTIITNLVYNAHNEYKFSQTCKNTFFLNVPNNCIHLPSFV